MPRTRRRTKTLLKASEALSYEAWMLFNTAIIFYKKVNYPLIVHNAMLEAFVTHLRVLIDFFYLQAQKDDDIVAQDFFLSPGGWADISLTYRKRLKLARKKANKQLAHLTYTRLKKKSWNASGPLRDIRDSLTTFVDNVDGKKIHPNLTSFVNQIRHRRF